MKALDHLLIVTTTSLWLTHRCWPHSGHFCLNIIILFEAALTETKQEWFDSKIDDFSVRVNDKFFSKNKNDSECLEWNPQSLFWSQKWALIVFPLTEKQRCCESVTGRTDKLHNRNKLLQNSQTRTDNRRKRADVCTADTNQLLFLQKRKKWCTAVANRGILGPLLDYNPKWKSKSHS